MIDRPTIADRVALAAMRGLDAAARSLVTLAGLLVEIRAGLADELDAATVARRAAARGQRPTLPAGLARELAAAAACRPCPVPPPVATRTPARPAAAA